MPNKSSIPSKPLILVALVQGLALLLLHQSMELDFWPHDAPQWLFSFYSVAVAAPTMLLLGLIVGSERIILQWTACFTLIVLGLGYYIGSQAIPLSYSRYEFLLVAFVSTLCVATFKALMYVQHFATGEPLSYSRLFQLSWRNFLTLALSLLFTLCFWGVLMLWAGLFKAIKIEFFYDLFTERWFYYPVLALANGFGVILFRQQSQVIDTITRIQQALMKFLLVILVFVSVIFLAALPFTGLNPLWDTGGSTLILWMQALMLFFVNAVYQDDPEAHPYHLWVHRFIYIGLALLPIYSIVSFYGLSLRVDQYGWSLSRCWAFLLWGVFALFSLGYLWGIAKLRDNWLNQLSWVNVRMGLVILALMLIVNSPILDFRKISVNSQIARLNEGVVSLEDFDYRYLRSELAKPGYEALEDLKKQVAESNPDILVKINSLYISRGGDDIGSTKTEFISAINVLGGTAPDGLTDAIVELVQQNPWRLQYNLGYYLLALDLNGDDQEDFIFVEQRMGRHSLTLFYKVDNRWHNKMLVPTGSYRGQGDALIEGLKQGSYSGKEADWKQFEVGEFLFQVQ